MRDLLGPDGLPYRVLSRWLELVLLSLGWFLLALPVVTAPVATDWLLDGVRRGTAGLPLRGPRDTLDFLRRRFLATLPLAAVHLLVIVLLLVALLGPSPGPFGPVVLVVAVVVGTTWALVAPWSVVLLDRRSTREALRASYLRALRHLPLSFLSLVAVVGGIAMVLTCPDWVRLPVVLTAPGALAAWLVGLCERAGPSDVVARTSPFAPIHRFPVRKATS